MTGVERDDDEDADYYRSPYSGRVSNTRTERNPVNGEEVQVTDHADGSTTYHFGAMVGDVKYDRFGRETC